MPVLSLSKGLPKLREEDKMKRLLCLLLVSVIWSISSYEAWGLDFKYNGDIRFRAFLTNNLLEVCPGPDGDFGTSDDTTCDDQEAFTDARFRLKMSATEGITTGVVAVDFLSQKGRNVATLNPSTTVQTGNRRLGSEGFGGGLDSIVLREGYLQATFPWFSVLLGRQVIQLGHSLILDDTADALVVAFPAGPVGLTFGNLVLVESDRGINIDIDTDLYFSHAAWTPAPSAVTSLFLVYLRDRGPNLTFNGVCEDPDPDDPNSIPPAFQRCDLKELGDDLMRLFVAGWTLDTESDHFHLGLEVDLLNGWVLNHSGEDIKIRGFNGLIQMDLIWPGIQVGLTGVYASGQKTRDLPAVDSKKLNINAISPNFVLGNILVNNEINSDRDGGSIGGLTAVKLAIERPLWYGLQGELAVIWARLTQRPAPGVDPDLGWEVDFNSTYPLDDHLLLMSGFGFLFPGEGWQGLFGDPEAEDLQIKLTTILTYTF